MKKRLYSSVIMLSLVAILGAQGRLTPTSSLPVPDGSVSDGEYQFSSDQSGMSLGASLGSEGKLYLSIRAKTAGWVALGVGSQRMDGSRLFLAYDTGAKQVFNEQLGTGHFHKDLADPIVEKWAVKADGGFTTLELVMGAGSAVAEGKLGLLFAYSGSTSYMLPHKARGSLSLTIAQ